MFGWKLNLTKWSAHYLPSPLWKWVYRFCWFLTIRETA